MGISGRDSENANGRIQHPVNRTSEEVKIHAVTRENKLAAKATRIEERESEVSYTGVNMQRAALERFFFQPADEESESEVKDDKIKVSKKDFAKYMTKTQEESFTLGLVLGQQIERKRHHHRGDN